MIALLDQWLADIGTQKLVDGDKVRDMLLDLRLMAAREESNDVQVDDEGEGAYPLLAGEEAGII